MTHVTFPRITAAVLIVIVVALCATGLSIGSIVMAVVGPLVTGFGLSRLFTPRPASAYPDQEPLIRHLWQTARALPDDRVFVDLVSGNRFAVERFRGFLTLEVADPDTGDADAQREQLVTRYMLGFAGRPIGHPCSKGRSRSTLGQTTRARRR